MTKFFMTFFAVSLMSVSAQTQEINYETAANTFNTCLCNALTNQGVKTSIEEIDWYSLNAIVPAINKNEKCLINAVLNSRPLSTDYLSQLFGLKVEDFRVSASKWKSLTIRNYTRRAIQNEAKKGNLALVFGGWDCTKKLWMKSNGTNFMGQSGPYNFELVGRPDRFLFLSATNSASTSQILVPKFYKIIANNIRGFNQNRLTGIEAIYHITTAGLYQHKCQQCQDTQAKELLNVMNIWKNDAEKASVFLKAELKHMPSIQKATWSEIIDKHDEYMFLLEASIDELIQYTDFPVASEWNKIVNSITLLTEPLWQIGNGFAKLSGMPVLNIPPYAAPAFSSFREKRMITKYLPLFSDLKDQDYSFLCAGILGSQLINVLIKPAFIKGASGFPFKLMLNTNTFLLDEDLPGNIDLTDIFFAAIKKQKGQYILSGKENQKQLDSIRTKIVDSINHKKPVLCSNNLISNDWGLIIGYDISGDLLFSRLASDTNVAFNTSYILPKNLIFFEDGGKPYSFRSKTISMLKDAVRTEEDYAPYLTGTNLLHYIERQSRYYGEKNILPPIDFAVANYKIWNSLLNKRRAAYEYLDYVMPKLPDLLFPLNNLRKIYFKEVEAINAAIYQKSIVNAKDGIIYPFNYQAQNLIKAADAMLRVIELENKSIENAQVILNNLKKSKK